MTCARNGSTLAAEIGQILVRTNPQQQEGTTNMTLRQRKSFIAIAILLAFSLAQVYVQTSLAEPGANSPRVPVPQQFVARLTTRGGAITLNGASASSGATVLTGATLETPDQVSATVDLGPLGTIDLQPNSSIQLDFDSNGNVRLKLLRGCAVMKKKGSGVGEVYTAEGASEKTSSSRKGLGFCYLNGKLNPIGSAAAGHGLSTGAKVAIALGIGGGTGIAIWLATRNPSP